MIALQAIEPPQSRSRFPVNAPAPRAPPIIIPSEPEKFEELSVALWLEGSSQETDNYSKAELATPWRVKAGGFVSRRQKAGEASQTG